MSGVWINTLFCAVRMAESQAVFCGTYTSKFPGAGEYRKLAYCVRGILSPPWGLRLHITMGNGSCTG